MSSDEVENFNEKAKVKQSNKKSRRHKSNTQDGRDKARKLLLKSEFLDEIPDEEIEEKLDIVAGNVTTDYGNKKSMVPKSDPDRLIEVDVNKNEPHFNTEKKMSKLIVRSEPECFVVFMIGYNFQNFSYVYSYFSNAEYVKVDPDELLHGKMTDVCSRLICQKLSELRYGSLLFILSPCVIIPVGIPPRLTAFVKQTQFYPEEVKSLAVMGYFNRMVLSIFDNDSLLNLRKMVGVVPLDSTVNATAILRDLQVISSKSNSMSCEEQERLGLTYANRSGLPRLILTHNTGIGSDYLHCDKHSSSSLMNLLKRRKAQFFYASYDHAPTCFISMLTVWLKADEIKINEKCTEKTWDLNMSKRGFIITALPASGKSALVDVITKKDELGIYKDMPVIDVYEDIFKDTVIDLYDAVWNQAWVIPELVVHYENMNSNSRALYESSKQEIVDYLKNNPSMFTLKPSYETTIKSIYRQKFEQWKELVQELPTNSIYLVHGEMDVSVLRTAVNLPVYNYCVSDSFRFNNLVMRTFKPPEGRRDVRYRGNGSSEDKSRYLCAEMIWSAVVKSSTNYTNITIEDVLNGVLVGRVLKRDALIGGTIITSFDPNVKEAKLFFNGSELCSSGSEEIFLGRFLAYYKDDRINFAIYYDEASSEASIFDDVILSQAQDLKKQYLQSQKEAFVETDPIYPIVYENQIEKELLPRSCPKSIDVRRCTPNFKVTKNLMFTSKDTYLMWKKLTKHKLLVVKVLKGTSTITSTEITPEVKKVDTVYIVPVIPCDARPYNWCELGVVYKSLIVENQYFLIGKTNYKFLDGSNFVELDIDGMAKAGFIPTKKTVARSSIVDQSIMDGITRCRRVGSNQLCYYLPANSSSNGFIITEDFNVLNSGKMIRCKWDLKPLFSEDIMYLSGVYTMDLPVLTEAYVHDYRVFVNYFPTYPFPALDVRVITDQLTITAPKPDRPKLQVVTTTVASLVNTKFQGYTTGDVFLNKDDNVLTMVIQNLPTSPYTSTTISKCLRTATTYMEDYVLVFSEKFKSTFAREFDILISPLLEGYIVT